MRMQSPPVTARVGCLGRLLALLGVRGRSHSQGRTPWPYRRKDYLLTRAERAFFAALQEASGGRYLICAKVRLEDLLWLPKGTVGRQPFRNRVRSRHVDFVLCRPEDIRPMLAIELDDRSHDAEDRKARDTFVNDALADAGLPILRVRAARSYAVSELKHLIGEEIRK